MFQLFVTVLVFFFLLIIFEISVALGRYYGRRHISKNPDHKIEVVGVAESAVFGLLALLIAFTFSGAYDRFEHRKLHLLEEAHSYELAYEYVSVFPDKYQQTLQQGIRDYLSANINAYKDSNKPASLIVDEEKSDKIRNSIWQTAVIASHNTANQSAAANALQAVSDMFAKSNTGIMLSKVHPPVIIFALLIILAALGAFLAGYISAESKHRRPIHTLFYVILTAFTIYVVINLEYPRAGFIGLDYFDNNLVTIRDSMHP